MVNFTSSIIEKASKSALLIKDNIPYIAFDAYYEDMTNSNIGWWTNSFYSGILWYLYKETNNEEFASWAKNIERKLDIVLDGVKDVDHDAGFMWILTSVCSYKLTNDLKSKKRALRAADLLFGRFNKKGQYIQAWNGDWAKGWAIIDTMMNLSLLYWASKETIDNKYKEVAIKCADTVLKHFIDENGSVRHIVMFDEKGNKKGVKGGQGYNETSSWGRGTAWALYGLTITYRETKEERFLNAANKVASFIKKHLPSEGVPYADYLAPKEEKRKLDSSAGAISACGFYLLYQLTNDNEYLNMGNKIIEGLKKTCLAPSDYQPLLLHGNVAYHTDKIEERDCSLIYGDFFFIEALMLLNKKDTFF